ncbi:hypothetical protein Taro_026488 [Colocasia esculenta]|uniref:Uncharacterized protein n=1 Tax=Colocasia esculenta TaxID=4460 RepID=A0A843VJP2_COLES|nr:hypothetical protein [Colocasia esculenta]
MVPVDSQEGAVDIKQQTELRFAGLCVSVDSNQGPVDSYTQSRHQWLARSGRDTRPGHVPLNRPLRVNPAMSRHVDPSHSECDGPPCRDPSEIATGRAVATSEGAPTPEKSFWPFSRWVPSLIAHFKN